MIVIYHQSRQNKWGSSCRESAYKTTTIVVSFIQSSLFTISVVWWYRVMWFKLLWLILFGIKIWFSPTSRTFLIMLVFLPRVYSVCFWALLDKFVSNFEHCWIIWAAMDDFEHCWIICFCLWALMDRLFPTLSTDGSFFSDLEERWHIVRRQKFHWRGF